jgi:hypothetical protein
MMFSDEIALHCVGRGHARYGAQLQWRTLVGNMLWVLSNCGIAGPLCSMNIARRN